MNKSIFEFQDYKAYLLNKIGKTGTRTGMRSGLASAVVCNTAYISQVLNGSSEFSLEQAEKANHYLGHTEEESHFFLLLVQYARAGTTALRKYFESQIKLIVEQRVNIQKRLGVKKNLSESDQATYYSAWHIAAIHVALSIPQLNRAEFIATYFDLPLKKVKRALEFLVSVGLAEEHSGTFSIGKTYIHLNKDSENILRHHTNWRLRAIETFDRDKVQDLHYASVVTLSKKDAFKIQDLIIENIQKMNTMIADSKEEEVYCFTSDFFILKK